MCSLRKLPIFSSAISLPKNQEHADHQDDRDDVQQLERAISTVRRDAEQSLNEIHQMPPIARAQGRGDTNYSPSSLERPKICKLLWLFKMREPTHTGFPSSLSGREELTPSTYRYSRCSIILCVIFSFDLRMGLQRLVGSYHRVTLSEHPMDCWDPLVRQRELLLDQKLHKNNFVQECDDKMHVSKRVRSATDRRSGRLGQTVSCRKTENFGEHPSGPAAGRPNRTGTRLFSPFTS